MPPKWTLNARNLGCLNGWAECPPEFKTCREMGHKRVVLSRPAGNRSGLSVEGCEICMITWCYDTSD